MAFSLSGLSMEVDYKKVGPLIKLDSGLSAFLGSVTIPDYSAKIKENDPIVMNKSLIDEKEVVRREIHKIQGTNDSMYLHSFVYKNQSIKVRPLKKNRVFSYKDDSDDIFSFSGFHLESKANEIHTYHNGYSQTEVGLFYISENKSPIFSKNKVKVAKLTDVSFSSISKHFKNRSKGDVVKSKMLKDGVLEYYYIETTDPKIPKKEKVWEDVNHYVIKINGKTFFDKKSKYKMYATGELEITYGFPFKDKTFFIKTELSRMGDCGEYHYLKILKKGFKKIIEQKVPCPNSPC